MTFSLLFLLDSDCSLGLGRWTAPTREQSARMLIRIKSSHTGCSEQTNSKLSPPRL